MWRRGYVLSGDALIALVIVMFVLLGFMSLPHFRSLRASESGFQQIHLKTEDAMEAMSNEGKLKQISYEWVRYAHDPEVPLDAAAAIARENLEDIMPPTVGYKLMIEKEVIYTTDLDQPSRPKESESKDKTRAVRYVAGQPPPSDVMGWFAKASLNGNFTRSSTKVRWPDVQGENYTSLDFNFSKDHREEIVYLSVPKDCVVLNGSVSLTWNSSATPDCPMWWE